MALPDFIIIGAMKCGTSTLAAQLGAQSGIFMSTPKEPNFFSDDANFARGLASYEALFELAQPGDLKGEASTHYTKLPVYPATLGRLQSVLPAPKLICLIRNPLERAISHYVHEWSMGGMPGDLETELDRNPGLIAYGRYGYQLAPWVDAFGSDSIFVSSLEAMTAAPQAFLDRVGGFLGYRGALVWRAEKTLENASAERVRRFPFHGLLIDSPVAATLRRALVPKALRDRIRQSRKIAARPEISAARRRSLEAVFADDHALLAGLFPGNADIAAAYPFLR